jgi:hypothetical protein
MMKHFSWLALLLAAAVAGPGVVHGQGGFGVGGTVTAVNVAGKTLTVEYQARETKQVARIELTWTDKTQFLGALAGDPRALRVGQQVTCGVSGPDAAGKYTLGYAYVARPVPGPESATT